MKEHEKAKQAWLDYLAMDVGERSLDTLAARYRARSEVGPVPTRDVSTLKRWSSTYGWQLRLQHIANEARAQAERRAIAERAAAIKEHNDTMMMAATRLVKRAQDMESYPLHQEVVSDDGQTTVIQPIRWTASDIARNYEAADKLMRTVLAQMPGGADDAALDKWIRDMLDREGVDDLVLREKITSDVKSQLSF